MNQVPGQTLYKELLGEKESTISELKAELYLLQKQSGTSKASDKKLTLQMEDLKYEKFELIAELNSLKSEHSSLRNLVKGLNQKINDNHPDRDDIRFSELFKSKSEDLSVYEHTIEETRRIFMDAMKQMKAHLKKQKTVVVGQETEED